MEKTPYSELVKGRAWLAYLRHSAANPSRDLPPVASSRLRYILVASCDNRFSLGSPSDWLEQNFRLCVGELCCRKWAKLGGLSYVVSTGELSLELCVCTVCCFQHYSSPWVATHLERQKVMHVPQGHHPHWCLAECLRHAFTVGVERQPLFCGCLCHTSHHSSSFL